MFGQRRRGGTAPAADPYAGVAQDRVGGLQRPVSPDEYDPNERMPLIYWLGWAAWKGTRGSARIDAIRPTAPKSQGRSGFLGFPRVRPDQLFRPPTLPDEEDYHHTRRFSLLGKQTGARFQLMRHIDLGARRRRHYHRSTVEPSFDRDGYDTDSAILSQNKHGRSYGLRPAWNSIKGNLWEKLVQPERPWIDLGAGFNFDLDSAYLMPKARVKIKDLFSIKLCPNPSLKLQKRWQLPGSATAVRLHWDLPLSKLLEWDSRDPVPSRIWCRLENNVGRNVHLTPSGLDFDEHVWYLGGGTALRFGGGLQFPRELPVPPGQPPLNWRVQRLGIKTRW